MFDKKKKNLIPMNIQKFAEGGADGAEVVENVDSAELTSEQMIARIAELEADNALQKADALKWKTASDKASGEAANYKRQLTARMSAQEQADQAKIEAEQAKDQKLKDYEARIAELEKNALRAERKAFYTSPEIGMEENLAVEIAEAQVNGDWSKFDSALKKHMASVKEAVRTSVLGERGATHAGNGSSETDPAMAIVKNLGGRKGNANTDILKGYM